MLPLTARCLTRWDAKNPVSTERIPVAASSEQKSLSVNCGLLGGFLDVDYVEFKIPHNLEHRSVASGYGKRIMDIFATDETMWESSIFPQDDSDQGLKRFFGLSSTDNICPSLTTRIPIAVKSSSTLMEELLDSDPSELFSVNLLRCIGPKPSIEALCASRVLSMRGMTSGLHHNDQVAHAINRGEVCHDHTSVIDRLLYSPTLSEPDHLDPMTNINRLWEDSCMDFPKGSHQQGCRLWLQSTDLPFIPTTLHVDMVEVGSYPPSYNELPTSSIQ